MNTRTLSIILALLGLSAIGAGTAQAARPSIADLQAQITALQANNVPGLASYVSVDTSVPSRPAVRITAANLQVVNGQGATDTVNGVGNVVVGYDEARINGSAVCSLGAWADQVNCESHGGTWALSHKSGSHNVVIGRQHAYSRYGGLVAGFGNVVNGADAAVAGGWMSVASGAQATVSGGLGNTASGAQTSVSGGSFNTASANFASVHGGSSNTASSGDGATVAGGSSNTASGNQSFIGGGSGNHATGGSSSVVGGASNTATGLWSGVFGGTSNTANGQDSAVVGGYGNQAQGGETTVTGGLLRQVSTQYFWVGGNSLAPQ